MHKFGLYFLVLVIVAAGGAVQPSFSQQETAPAAPPAVSQQAPPTTSQQTLPELPAPAASDPAVVPDTPADPSAPDVSGDGTDGLSLGDIPDVATEELNPDMARKALDAYVLVQTKYQDSPLENYDDLQSFVDKDPKGKDFETDIKSFGFANVNDWNLAITTLSFAYTNALDDQTADIKQQIEEIKADTTTAKDLNDRKIKSLEAMIPSANNSKIVSDLMADPVYGEKIKLLETTEE